MSKQQHKKQLEQARSRRQHDRYERRQSRNRMIVFLMVALMILSLVAGALVSLFGNDTPEPAAGAEDEPRAQEEELQDLLDQLPEAVCPEPVGVVPDPTTEPYEQPPRYEIDPSAEYVATLVTTCGDIVVELDTLGSPRTAENFLALANDGYYDGSPFHRILAGFVIQGGDPVGTGTGCVDEACETRLPGYTFDDELETAAALPPAVIDGEEIEGVVTYPRGTVAMANTGQPGSQGSQFFVVVPEQGQPFPPTYTVFGRVVDGMEVVDDIVAGPAIGDQAVDPVRVLGIDIDAG